MSQLVFRVAKKWIAGLEVGEAVRVARSINEKRIGVILNYLGEDVTDRSTAEDHAQEYLSLQRLIAENGIDGCVSVKLTQFGLSVSERLARDRVQALAEEAARLKQPLWMDMEGSGNTEKTLEIYSSLLQTYSNVGVALQAYMRRSERDLEALIEAGGRVRLCKGAYREPPELVYASRAEIDSNFSKLMGRLFEGGCSHFAVATHDSKLIEEAKRLAQAHRVSFEFEMLKGIRDDLKEELAGSGYRVVEYVPYGKEWYRYSMRRVREHPSNLWLLLRSLV